MNSGPVFFIVSWVLKFAYIEYSFEVYTCAFHDAVTIPMNACSSLLNWFKCCQTVFGEQWYNRGHICYIIDTSVSLSYTWGCGALWLMLTITHALHVEGCLWDVNSLSFITCNHIAGWVQDYSNPIANVLGPNSIYGRHLTSIGKSYCGDNLISTMGFPILVRRHLYVESGP